MGVTLLQNRRKCRRQKHVRQEWSWFTNWTLLYRGPGETKERGRPPGDRWQV